VNVRLQWAIIAVITLFLLRPIASSFSHRIGLPDFGVFYCAGATHDAGGKPYLWADLDRCGNGAQKPVDDDMLTGSHRWPAPLPGYEVALFGIVADALPYVQASYAWLAICTLALLVAIFCISEVAGVSPLIVFAALAFPMFRTCLYWGQLPALFVAFISIAAYAINRRQYTMAALAAACTLVEPHLGIPTCLAMLCWIPQCRTALLACCAALAAISLATLGVAGNYEYVHTILPLHVGAEVPFPAQLSLAWLLYVFGVNESVAVRIAELSYYVMIAFALYVTRKLPAIYVPIVPAALVVIGGPFIHINQVEVATVAALVFAGRKKTPLAWSAVAMLSVLWYALPWIGHRFNTAQLACALVVAVITAYGFRAQRPVVRWTSTAAAPAIYMLLTTLFLHASSIVIREPNLVAYQATLAGLEQYASAPWGMQNHTSYFHSTLGDLLWKIPTWCALGIIAWQCWLMARTASDTSVVPAWNRRTFRPRASLPQAVSTSHPAASAPRSAPETRPSNL
jgi:hypothetical protein